MDSHDADPALLAVIPERDVPAQRQRQVVLAGLVALRQVRVRVVLAVEAARWRDLAVEGQAHSRRKLDGSTVHHGQHAGKARADGAYMGVRLGPGVLSAAAAEHFAARLQLRVNLQPYYRLVTHLVLVS